MLWLAGFRNATKVRGVAAGAFLRSNAVTLVLVLGLGGQLTMNLRRTIAQEVFAAAVRHKIAALLDGSQGSRLAGVRFETRGDHVIVSAVVRGPAMPSGEQVAAMERSLPVPSGGSIELRVRFVETRTIDKHGVVSSEDLTATP